MNRATTILIFCVALLLGLGMVALYSASMNMDLGKETVGSNFLRQQMIWCVFGLLGCAVAASVDYRRWKEAAPWLLVFSALLLVLVFVPKIGYAATAGRAGSGKFGAHRWIGLPHLPHFQPSELAKLALVLFLAAYAERHQRHMGAFKKGLVIPGAVILGVLLLIFVEPDRGCAIFLAAVAGTMLVIAGVRLLYLVPPLLAAMGVLAYSLFHDPMRLNRILAWLHPEQNKNDAGYQAYEAMIAFGSGGWTGLGLGNSRQKMGFVPEHHTDFILPIIGEELGLVTTLAVVLLFMVLVICGIYIARRAADTFGLLLAAGLTFMIGIQALINMAVVTSLLPNKGMPLPFISYGGSDLLLMLVSVGLLLSISRFATEPVRASSNPFDPIPIPNHA
ncbi:MAG: putative lipid II flippase FtsW [Verrucomicrobiota bacterium]|jgi:cell division protein FtsW